MIKLLGTMSGGVLASFFFMVGLVLFLRTIFVAWLHDIDKVGCTG
jgi:hypothetical protein